MYLPALLTPPLTSPAAPRISPFDNPSGVSSYDVAWSTAPFAEIYEVKENGTLIYRGSERWRHLSGKTQGQFCYVVTAENAAGASEPSDPACTDVAAWPVFMPRDGVWRSADGQRFTVRDGQLVKVGMDVPPETTATGSMELFNYYFWHCTATGGPYPATYSWQGPG